MLGKINSKKWIIHIVSFILIPVLLTVAVVASDNIFANESEGHDMNTSVANSQEEDGGTDSVIDYSSQIDESSDEPEIDDTNHENTEQPILMRENQPTMNDELVERKDSDSVLESRSSITVNTFEELKQHLEDSDSVDITIYFGSDIVQTSGVSVPKDKNVTISGRDPETNIIHTYTEMHSGTQSKSIQVSGNTDITIRDMNIDGYNHYGTVTSTLNLSHTAYIRYDNVNYNGPQLAYTPYSTVHIKDSDITIPENKKDQSSSNQETIESCRVILEGKTSIQHLNSAYPTIKIRNYNSPELSILPGSNIQIVTNYYLMNAPKFTTSINIGEGAVFSVYAKGSIGNVDYELKSLIVRKDSVFKYVHDGTKGARRTINTNVLRVDNNATFDVRRTNASYNSTTNTKVLIGMMNKSPEIIFNEPKRVILVNALNTIDGVLLFNNSGRLDINTKAINLWEVLPSFFNQDIQSTDPGDNWDEIDIPTRVWNQKGFEPIKLSATYNSVSTAPSSLSVNGGYSPGEPLLNHSDLTKETFANSKTKVLTFGSTNIDINDVFTDSQSIEGNTLPNSFVTLKYNYLDTTQTYFGKSNDKGNYSIPIGDLTKDQTIYGTTQKDFLRGYSSTIVKENSGILRFYEVPADIKFSSNSTPIDNRIISRDDPNWSISVSDTRTDNHNWKLFASISSPLTANSNGMEVSLPNALVYKVGDQINPFNREPMLIHSGVTKDNTNGITTINWASDAGPLVNINAGDYPVSGSNYTTTIEWTLTDAP